MERSMTRGWTDIDPRPAVRAWALAVVVLTLAWGTPLMAGTPPTPEAPEAPEAPEPVPAAPKAAPDARGETDAQEKPWAAGVSPKDRQRASALYERAKQQKSDFMTLDALALFEESLALYPHPKTHGHIGLLLSGLNRLLDAHRHLQIALDHGPAAFGDTPGDKTLLKEVSERLPQVEAQLARVTVSTDTRGMEIRLDGAVVLTEPGRHTQFVVPGAHQVATTRKGYVPRTETLELTAAEHREYRPTLVSLQDAMATERRWAVWKPWSVFVGGVLVGGLGAGLQVLASRDLAAYDEHIESGCSRGCTDTELPANIRPLRARGRLRSGFGSGLLVVGGVGVIGGAVLLYLNRPRLRNPDLTRPDGRISVLPILGPEGPGAQLAWQF